MNIPAHILASANPLARATMIQMQERAPSLPPPATQQAALEARLKQARSALRVDIVADARQKADQAAGEAVMLGTMRKVLAQSDQKAVDPSLRVDIVANMRARCGLAKPEPRADEGLLAAAMRKQLNPPR